MPLDSPEIEPDHIPRKRLVGLRHLDRRCRQTKRAWELFATLSDKIGGLQMLDAHGILACERAACLLALAEDSRARRLNGDNTTTLNDLVRLDHAAALAVKALNLPERDDAPLTLESYLAGKYGADS